MFNERNNGQRNNTLNHLSFTIYQFTLIRYLSLISAAMIFDFVCRVVNAKPMINVKCKILITSEGGWG